MQLLYNSFHPRGVSEPVDRVGGEGGLAPAAGWCQRDVIDLNQNFALKMVLKKVGGTEYLFIEAGQIPRRVEAGWKPNFLVLKRK